MSGTALSAGDTKVRAHVSTFEELIQSLELDSYVRNDLMQWCDKCQELWEHQGRSLSQPEDQQCLLDKEHIRPILTPVSSVIGWGECMIQGTSDNVLHPLVNGEHWGIVSKVQNTQSCLEGRWTSHLPFGLHVKLYFSGLLLWVLPYD